MKKTYEILELDLEEEVIESIVKFALETIVNDRDALVEYGALKILENVVGHPEKIKQVVKKYREKHKDEICPKCDFLMNKKNVADNGGKCILLVCSNCNHQI